MYLQQRIASLKIRCPKKLHSFDYRQHKTNENVTKRVTSGLFRYQNILERVKSRIFKLFGHIVFSNGPAETCFQGTFQGKRSRGGPRKKWADNLSEWCCLDGWGILAREDVT